MTLIRGTEKVKLFLKKKRGLTGLSEGEILELELFGVISKRK